MRPLIAGACLTTACLMALAAMAPFAGASLTPVNGNVTVSSRSIELEDSAGNTISCPESVGAGTISANGSALSLSLAFMESGGTPCTLQSGLGAFAVWDFDCRLTFRLISSVAGTSAQANIVVDQACWIHVELPPPANGCTVEIVPQGLLAAADFRQATQRLVIPARGVRLSAGTGRACPGMGSTGTLATSYAVSPAFTIS